MTIVQVFNKSFRRLFVPAEYWAHFIKNTIRTSSATFKQGILCSRRILCLPFRQKLCIVMLCGRALRKENKRICLLLALWESSKVKSTESLLKKTCNHTANFYSQELLQSAKECNFPSNCCSEVWLNTSQSYIRNDSDFFWAASGIHLQDMAEYWKTSDPNRVNRNQCC